MKPATLFDAMGQVSAALLVTSGMAGTICRWLPPVQPPASSPTAILSASADQPSHANPNLPMNPSTALEPMIIQRPAFWVLGTLTRITPGSESGETFASIWNDFEAFRSAIQPHSTDQKYYGVSYPTIDRDRIDYLAGMAVRPVLAIPAGLELREVPGATYAAFACPVAAIGPTYQHIFGEWHPRSNLTIDESAPAFEQYPPAEDIHAPVLIHIPVHAPGG